MTTLSEEGIRRVRDSIAEWAREAVEQQAFADCLREHAENHQQRAHQAERQVQALQAVLAQQGVPEEAT